MDNIRITPEYNAHSDTLTHMPTIRSTLRITAALSIMIVSAPYSHASTAQDHTTTLIGFLGLNTAPSARMDEAGTIKAGTSTLDPYLHNFIGVQIATPLYINLRHTSEISNTQSASNHTYSGLDIKLRLATETAYRPEISLGLQSALGHKKMAGEFIALSKRYKSLDFTAGMGWGRYGQSLKIDNPLRKFGQHFDKNRNISDENQNGPDNWFSGETIGFFGGVEYFTPQDGISVKLDYGTDRDNTSHAPWGIGLSYAYNTMASASIGMQGTDKIMGRIAIQSTPEKWPLTHKSIPPKHPIAIQKPEKTDLKAIEHSAADDGIFLTSLSADQKSLSVTLDIPENTHTPQHIGRAMRHIISNSNDEIEYISITPTHNDLGGITLKLSRRDVENSMDKTQGSPQEVWRNTDIIVTDSKNKTHTGFIQPMGIVLENPLTLTLENQISLSEKGSGIAYRSSALASVKTSPLKGFIFAISGRLNLKDNLETFQNTNITNNTNALTQKRLTLENAYIANTSTIRPNLHTSLIGGYLNESYAGIGGEILYRPYNSRLAIGVELWHAAKRDPNTSAHFSLEHNQITTGHLNAWYDIPNNDLTLKASAGRFLNNDNGLAIGFEKSFKNGAKISSDLTISNQSDTDINGGSTNTYHTVNLSLPLGSLRYIPDGSTILTSITPFNRDNGQRIKSPLNLFSMTENFTLDHMAQHWTDISN